MNALNSLKEIAKEIVSRRYREGMTATERQVAEVLCKAGLIELTQNGVYRYPLKLFKGVHVQALVKITSDDRDCGQNKTDPVVKVGERGVVLGRSEEFLEKGHRMKQGNCWAVQFEKGKNYDVHATELVTI